jgi:hypothetical protein
MPHPFRFRFALVHPKLENRRLFPSSLARALCRPHAPSIICSSAAVICAAFGRSAGAYAQH